MASHKCALTFHKCVETCFYGFAFDVWIELIHIGVSSVCLFGRIVNEGLVADLGAVSLI